jgi:signal transduction histidine kinase/CheY-like chemotaxis protein
LTISPVRDERGQIIGASKIARDITERDRLLMIAREQAETTRQLSEFGAAVASLLDQTAVVQKVVDVATSLTRAEYGAFFYRVVDRQSGESYVLHALAAGSKPVGAPLPVQRAAEVFSPLSSDATVLRIADVTQASSYERLGPQFGLSAGHSEIRSYLQVPITNASGDVLGELLFGHSHADVFTQQHEQLAMGIAAWAAVALENARLYLEAREADRLKDEFLAVLSHELRTPLSAILGYARLLRGRVLMGEKADHGIEVIERNAKALTQIVDDVLDISRIVSGKVRLDVQPVELPVIMHNAVATIQPAADLKRVRVETIMDPRVGLISGDPNRLQQVAWNLLSNAVMFTPKGGRVQVRLERVNSHIELNVSDTGIGISREFLPHVFEPFRQADGGITRKTGGLGLGLSIVRHIVEMHGGVVEVESAGPGQGSTFRVRLPLMIIHGESPATAREHPRSERTAPLGGLEDLHGIRVLAIDDEADALELLRASLEAAGADVSTRSSAIGALEQIDEVQPDVLVVDLGMPLMDGYEFIRSVRGSPNARVRRVPAAALTAFARSEDRIKVLRSGFEMHLAKPIDPGELVASVATLVRRAAMRE